MLLSDVNDICVPARLPAYGVFMNKTTLTYDEFKAELIKRLTGYFPEGTAIEQQTIEKNNGRRLDAISVFTPMSRMSPTIYPEFYYEEYQHCEDMDRVTEIVMTNYRKAEVMTSIDVSFLHDFDKVKDRIVFRLVNLEMNRNLLKDLVYIPYMDLAIIFSCIINSDEESSAHVLIRTSIAESWGVSVKELYRLSLENTPKILPYVMDTIENVIMNQCQDFSDGLPEDTSQDCMYVLTNISKQNGACCILYDHLLQKIADRLGKDFYIIPSSIHEVILLPANDAISPEDLAEIIQDGNQTVVSHDEILSDHAYYFSRRSNTVSY